MERTALHGFDCLQQVHAHRPKDSRWIHLDWHGLLLLSMGPCVSRVRSTSQLLRTRVDVVKQTQGLIGKVNTGNDVVEQGSNPCSPPFQGRRNDGRTPEPFLPARRPRTHQRGRLPFGGGTAGRVPLAPCGLPTAGTPLNQHGAAFSPAHDSWSCMLELHTVHRTVHRHRGVFCRRETFVGGFQFSEETP